MRTSERRATPKQQLPLLQLLLLLPLLHRSMATTADPIDTRHMDASNACCNGNNVFDDEALDCMEGSSALMLRMCDQKYMLDPLSHGEGDAFRITAAGLDNGVALHEPNRFCHMLLRVGDDSSQEQTNTSRSITSANEKPRLHRVALVCFEPMPQKYYTLFVIKGTLGLVSVAFLAATLYVYHLLPDLRETQDKVTCVALACLMVFLMLLAVLQLVGPAALGVACVPIGATMYYMTMAYFAWLNVIMFNVWKTSTMARWKIKERYWYITNHVYGWTLPAIASALLFWHSENHFDTNSCFLQRKSSSYFMYVPISVILFVNVVLFFWSAWGIHSTGQDVSSDKRKALAYKFRLYLKLIMLAGITWIFEIVSYYYGDSNHGWNMWLATDLMNALHGLGVFLVLVVCRRRIRKELANKRILCCRAPASWAEEREADNEEGGLQADVEKEPNDWINANTSTPTSTTTAEQGDVDTIKVAG